MIITPAEVLHGIQLYGAIHVIYFVSMKLVLKLGNKLNSERASIVEAHYSHGHDGHVKHCYLGFCHKLSSTQVN